MALKDAIEKGMRTVLGLLETRKAPPEQMLLTTGAQRKLLYHLLGQVAQAVALGTGNEAEALARETGVVDLGINIVNAVLALAKATWTGLIQLNGTLLCWTFFLLSETMHTAEKVQTL